MKKSTVYYVKIAILSICVSMAFCMDYASTLETTGSTGIFGELFLDLYLSLSGKMMLGTILAVLTLYFLIKTEAVASNCPRIIHVFAPIVASLWILYISYSNVNSLSLIYSTKGQIIKSLILLLGYATIIDRLCCLFESICQKDYSTENRFNFFKSHCYLKIALILSAVWLPGLILSYPGNTITDTWAQIAMAFGSIARTTHHPAVATMILYAFISLGKNVFNSPNVGLFLCGIFQVIYAIIAFSYMLKAMMEDFNSPKWLVIFTFVIMAFSPYFSNSLAIIQKDIPYAVSYMLLSTELMIFLKNPEMLKTKKHILISALSVMGIYLFRNNGLHSLVIILAVFSIVFLKKHMLKYMAVFIIPMVLSAAIVSSVTYFGGFSDGSKVEMLCLPMQQVARIVRLFPEDVTEEQKEVLENVCDYERMSQAYTMLIADPVKDTFYKYESTDKYLDFLKVWLQLAIKHPTTAVSATVAQNLPLISPLFENSGISYGLTYYQIVAPQIMEDTGIHECVELINAKDGVLNWYQFMTVMPVVGTFSQQSIYVILLLLMTCCAIGERNHSYLLSLIPSYVCLLMIIIGPCIQYDPRYAFPIIYQMPMLIAYYVYSKKFCGNKSIPTECL